MQQLMRIGVGVLALACLAMAQKPASNQASPITKAVAVLHPTKGSKVQGAVTFTKVQNGIRVQATVSGLTPGKHGFHVHQFGDCSAPDATSAGGHFEGTGQQHAGPEHEHRHAGDFGNIEAGSDGIGRYDRVDNTISFTGPNNILGRGVIVHEKADDLTTQPTGGAGGRVACGVIGVAKD